MIIQAHQNANGSVITVTNTATALYSLINTAAGTTASRAGFDVDCNGVDLIVESGSVRVLFDGNTPTALKGILLEAGVHRFRNVILDNTSLIRVGSSNVSVGVQVGKADKNESSSFGSSSDISLTEFPDAAALTDDFVTPTTTQVGAFGMVYDGATWDMQRGDATNGTLVNLGANNDVTLAVLPDTASGDLAALAAVIVTDDSAQVSTPPFFNVGGEYRATPTTYTDGDGAILQMNANGVAYSDMATGLNSSDDQVGAVIEASATATGCDMHLDSDVDNTAQSLKATPGVLYGLNIINGGATLNSAPSYLQLFDDVTGNITVGTSTPNYIIPVPANGYEAIQFPTPLDFGTAISYALTTTPTGSTDPTNGGTLSANYK